MQQPSAHGIIPWLRVNGEWHLLASVALRRSDEGKDTLFVEALSSNGDVDGEGASEYILHVAPFSLPGVSGAQVPPEKTPRGLAGILEAQPPDFDGFIRRTPPVSLRYCLP